MAKKNEKKITEKIVKVPYSVQDTIPIYRISESGIFELEKKTGPHQYDRVYLISDINFLTEDEDGKEKIDEKFRMILNSMNVSYKIITSNLLCNNDKMIEGILKRAVEEKLTPMVDAYREIFEDRLKNGKNSMQKSKFFVVTCEREDFEMARIYFDTLESALEPLFDNLGSSLVPLNATERLRALHSFYRMGEEESFSFDWKEYLKLKRDWRNDIINLSLKEEEDYIAMENGRCACAMFVRKYPVEVEDMFVREIINLPFPLIYTIDVYPLDKSKAYDNIMNKYMNVQRSMEKEQDTKNKAGLFSTNVSYEKRVKHQNLEDALDDLRMDDEKYFYVGMTFLLQADNREDLESRKNRLKQIGKGYGMEIVPCNWNQLDAMNTTLPVGVRFLENMRSLKTKSLSVFSPFEVQEINDENGLCYGYNQVSRQLIIGNRKSRQNNNANGFVFGETGAGKSLFVKSEMGQVLCFTRDDVICVDPMGEYKDIAKRYHGQYIDLTGHGKSNTFVNPFHVYGDVPENGMQKFLEEKAEFAFAICEQAMKPLPLTNKQVYVIDKAVREMYQDYFRKRKEKKSEKAKRALSCPTIKDLRQYIISQKSEYTENLVEELEVFVEGTLSIFSHQQSMEKNNRFTIFGMENIGKRLRPLALLVMMSSITNNIKYNQENKISTWVYLDEVHELWKHEYSLIELERLWKEVRKRGGVCTGITQNITDALENSSTQSMVSNSSFKCLLNQGSFDYSVMPKILKISSAQMKYIDGAAAGTGLLQFGKKIIPFNNVIKEESTLYQLYNTDFEKKVVKEKRKLNA